MSLVNNISNNTQAIPQPRKTIIPRHQRKERFRINKDRTNAIYKTVDKLTYRSATEEPPWNGQ